MASAGVNITERCNDAARHSGQVVAVIGGAGFIGSRLCEVLLTEGHFVVCIDNFLTGRKQNVDHLIERHFALVDHDVTEPLGSQLPRFDYIYNLACPASPVHYQSDRVRTALVCALGTLNTLERARADGASVFHASTSEVYGDPEIHPQTEVYFGNVNPVGPRSCYDEGKRFAETLLTDYGRQFGVPVKIARIFNTYGPRMQPDDGRVVSNFIVQALKGEDITLYGDGHQTRSFCYVDDLVEGIRRLTSTQNDADGPVNLGNPAEITVAALAKLIIGLTRSSSRIVRCPLPVDDPRRRRPDISKAQSLLGWSPTVELSIGLLKTVEYFASLLAQEETAKQALFDRLIPGALLDFCPPPAAQPESSAVAG